MATRRDIRIRRSTGELALLRHVEHAAWTIAEGLERDEPAEDLAARLRTRSESRNLAAALVLRRAAFLLVGGAGALDTNTHA